MAEVSHGASRHAGIFAWLRQLGRSRNGESLRESLEELIEESEEAD
jgi:hypothetical protein